MTPIQTIEEEIFAFLFKKGAKSQNRPTKEQKHRMLELLAALVDKGHNTFDLIFCKVWELRPQNHNKSEEYTRLRIYELLQNACLLGLVVKNDRVYTRPKGGSK